MASLTAFSYVDLDTAVHRLDPRVKLASLAVFSVTAVAVDPWAARAVLTLALLAGFAVSRLNPLKTLWSSRLFLFLAAAIVLTHGLEGGTLTLAGAERGARTAAGFLLVVLAAELTLSTTPTGRVTDVVHWALRPVPGVNAGRIALMAGLALRHAVILAAIHRRVVEAMHVRGMKTRRSPLRSVRIRAVLLLRESVLEAELTIDALAARGYADRRTPPAFSVHKADAVAAAAVAAIIGLSLAAGGLLAL
ncbi:MAG: energy-coupling factor transporter transmembrane component T family protein [Spirochaetota bacterium]